MVDSGSVKDKAKDLGLLKKKDPSSAIIELADSPLPITGEKSPEKPKITIIDYDEQHYHEVEVKDV